MKNKKYLKIVIIVVAVVLAVLVAEYVFPRVRAIILYKPRMISNEDLQKIEIEGIYIGQSYNVTVRNISMDLPCKEDEITDLYLYDPDGISAMVRPGGYSIQFYRYKGEPLHEDVEIDEEIQYLYLDSASFNEFNIKIHEYDYEKPSFFLPPEEIKIMYHIYNGLDKYWEDGNKYALVENEGYAFVIRMDDRDSGENQFYKVYIDIYDINDHYAHIADIKFVKRYMSIKEVKFIVDSISVGDY